MEYQTHSQNGGFQMEAPKLVLGNNVRPSNYFQIDYKTKQALNHSSYIPRMQWLNYKNAFKNLTNRNQDLPEN